MKIKTDFKRGIKKLLITLRKKHLQADKTVQLR
jgi:hypothetical protein